MKGICQNCGQEPVVNERHAIFGAKCLEQMQAPQPDDGWTPDKMFARIEASAKASDAMEARIAATKAERF